MLQYAVMAGLIKFALHLVQKWYWHSPPRPTPLHTLLHAFTVGLIDAHRLSNLTERFLILIRQSKRLHSTALLSSFYAPWPTGAFSHFFPSSTIVSWLQFYHVGQLHTVDVDTFFTILVQLFSDASNSQPSITQAGDWWNWPLLFLFLVCQLYFWSCFVLEQSSFYYTS